MAKTGRMSEFMQRFLEETLLQKGPRLSQAIDFLAQAVKGNNGAGARKLARAEDMRENGKEEIMRRHTQPAHTAPVVYAVAQEL